MELFLRPGPDPENWTERTNYIGVGVVPTGPAEMSLYFVDHFRHPSARLRRATLRLDGFVSVNAPYAGGEFVTRPLTFSGSELSINYATSAAGSVHVELQDAHGRPLDGFELGSSIEMFGDEIDRRVAWKDRPDLGSLADRPIRVRFVLKDADLYALQFSD